MDLKAIYVYTFENEETRKLSNQPKSLGEAVSPCLKGLGLAVERVPILTWKQTMFFLKEFDKALQRCTRGFVFYD